MDKLRFFSILSLVVLTIALPASAELIEIHAFDSAVVNDLLIEFDEFLFEERCPLDVTCIWEGDAAIRIVVSGGTTGSREFELHSYADRGSVAQYDEYTITMVELLPYPLLDIEPVPEDYVVTLQVEIVVSTDAITWSALKSRF